MVEAHLKNFFCFLSNYRCVLSDGLDIVCVSDDGSNIIAGFNCLLYTFVVCELACQRWMMDSAHP